MTLPDSMPDPDEYGRLPLASTWLAAHAAGEMDRKLSRALRDVVAAVTKLGASGTVTTDMSSICLTASLRVTSPPTSRAASRNPPNAPSTSTSTPRATSRNATPTARSCPSPPTTSPRTDP